MLSPLAALDGTRASRQRLILMRFTRRYGILLCLGLGVVALSARAEEKPFSATLPEAEQEAAGIAHLSPEQLSTLNNLVQRELVLAKQGETRAFAGEFSHRRSAPERAKAGIDKLTAQERVRLDADVAKAISDQPHQTTATLQPARSDTVVTAAGPRLEVHGSVSFVAGTSGGGRNFYGGEFEVEQYDPVHHVAIAFSYSELHGKGLWWPYGYGYGSGYRGGLGCGMGRY